RAGRVLMTLFAISGFAGLIYESIRTQYLGLFLGHAAYAQSFVLILFMGGMALGAWLVSRRSARIARPLAIYAVVELLIGVLGVAFDPLYRAVTGFAYASLFPLVGDGLGLDLTRYAISTLLIGVQCVALGATFPLMSAGYLRFASREGGRVLASLYFTNSFGAAIGALVATFVLVPNVGLPGTVMAGGLLSVLVALAVWPLGKEPSVAVAGNAALQVGTTPRLILAAAAITGATSFVYEITWIRMLALALGSTLHAFELMLAAFISGIAFGGLWLRNKADRWPDSIAAAGWVQVLMGIAALGSLFVYAHSFEWVAELMQGLSHTPTGYTLYNVATGAIAIAVMFPAAFFAGSTLPLLTLALLRRSAGEQAIGRVYSANTLGAIVGVLLAMHVLMPAVGVRVALWIAALGDMALGIVLLRNAGAMVRTRILAAAAVAIAASVVSLAFTRVDPLVLASAVYRSGAAELHKGTEMMFYGDGKTASVALFQSPDGQRRAIATNGKVDASISVTNGADPSPDEYTMTLAAALPLASIEQPRNAAVIGFGSGMTVHTLLGSERLERVDVIEIEPFMIEAARRFGERVERAYSDPRAHIVIDDAKAFLAGASRKYDIIVSEPSNPWVSGVAALFSDEFYDFVPRHLTKGGLYVQWLQLYEITPDLVSSVLKAMLPHFADVRAYLSNEGDMLLVASAEGPLPVLRSPAELDPKLRKELERLEMASSDDLELLSLMGKHGLTALGELSALPANSDFFPILQLRAPEARFMKLAAIGISTLQLSSLPILEVVGGYRPTDASTEPYPTVSPARRDAPRRVAREYREALLSGASVSQRFAKKEGIDRLEVIRAAMPDCSRFDAGEWVDASASIAGATIPFFKPADLEGVWIDPRWLPDCAQSDPLAGKAARLYSAVAARDWPSVVRVGSEIMEDDSGKGHEEFVSYVLRATELGYVAVRDWKSLRDTETKFGARSTDQLFERRLMFSLARLDAQVAGNSPPAVSVTPRD
ncbi:MAG TPA: fused MFS/spermidine synthase, partial [Rhodanobacteraceae bacterium]|nr:fused MFS/spermidine synthase [Rhodanobacteraceae bacterium]